MYVTIEYIRNDLLGEARIRCIVALYLILTDNSSWVLTKLLVQFHQNAIYTLP